MCCNDCGVNAILGLGSVCSFAGDVDLYQVSSSKEWAGADTEFANRNARLVVHAIDLLNIKLLHHAVLDHFTTTATAFFGGLENYNCSTVEITSFT